jgi:hypothetical protein
MLALAPTGKMASQRFAATAFHPVPEVRRGLLKTGATRDRDPARRGASGAHAVVGPLMSRRPGRYVVGRGGDRPITGELGRANHYIMLAR